MRPNDPERDKLFNLIFFDCPDAWEYIEELFHLRYRVARCLQYPKNSDYLCEIHNILSHGTQFDDGSDDTGVESFPLKND